jgi:hypothetical protein
LSLVVLKFSNLGFLFKEEEEDEEEEEEEERER